MCDNCGCGDEKFKMNIPGENHNHEHAHKHNHSHRHDGVEHDHEHDHSHHHEHNHGGKAIHSHHSHDHSHPHEHDHSHDHTHEINLNVSVLNKNNLIAERNRGFFDAKNIKVFNFVSSPGSGKTSLLERTILELNPAKKLYVIEGDQQTMNDAERIKKAGAPVIQINTGNGCHLDAEMIHQAVRKLQIEDNSILIIENVGNLVCPSMFDLGENKRVVVISVTEGEDKPLKYPNMFQTSDLCIINKIDLLPYLDFELEKCKEYAKRVNHHLEFIELSVKSGAGMNDWYNWLNVNAK
jgi:hydrogenase nickel incorporation protein HypB